MAYTQEEFARLSAELFSIRIGDFLYVHHEANPRWHYFSDIKGNTVLHGGRGDSTDVIVRIIPSCKEQLLERLMNYLKELVGRHGEVLHEEGRKMFHGVMISLPHKAFALSTTEVTVHTGSGCCYDQDEIAYEVMAALSGVPVYKAVSPRDAFYGFVRQDKIDDGGWISYWHPEKRIKVTFSHLDDNTKVCISRGVHHPREEWEKFKSLMHDIFAKFVTGRTNQPYVRAYGERLYEGENSKDSLSVDISSGSEVVFSMGVPYGLSFEHLPRLVFAKYVMESLYEVHKEEALTS